MRRIGFLVSVAVLVIAGAPPALAGRVNSVDPSLMQPPLKLAVEGDPAMPAVVDGAVFVGTSYGKVVAVAGDRDPTER